MNFPAVCHEGRMAEFSVN